MAAVAVLRMPPVPLLSVTYETEESKIKRRDTIMTRKDSFELDVECDSGCEADAGFPAPKKDQAVRIVEQLEEYFSDEHLTKDAFLLKHVRRTREGYVSLKLVSSFKRLKHLCNDWRQVAWSVRHYSANMELNSEGTKVRRIKDLPKTLIASATMPTSTSRCVLAMSLPTELSTVDALGKLFGNYGLVALIRLLRPNSPLPQEFKVHTQKYPALNITLCAVIEYETSESAVKAIKDIQHIKVELLTNTNNKKTNAARGTASQRTQRTTPTPPIRFREDSSSSTASDEDQYHHRRMTLTPPSSSYTTDTRRKSASWCESSSSPSSTPPQLSPWLQRRMAARRQSHDGRQSPSGLNGSDNILRAPRGPDGTKGFTSGFREHMKKTVTILPVILAEV